jgi:hypothetical protein
MKIDIDKLTEDELIDLNNRIVARLKFLHETRAHSQMLEFSIGDRVSFQPQGHPVLTAMLIRDNKKTVTVITDSGQQWNVAPGFLRKAAQLSSAPSRPATVIYQKNKRRLNGLGDRQDKSENKGFILPLLNVASRNASSSGFCLRC